MVNVHCSVGQRVQNIQAMSMCVCVCVLLCRLREQRNHKTDILSAVGNDYRRYAPKSETCQMAFTSRELTQSDIRIPLSAPAFTGTVWIPNKSSIDRCKHPATF